MKRQTLALPVALLCAAVAALSAPVVAEAAHASHAGGASDATSNDILCLVFSMSSANSQDQKAQISGLVGMAYYLGRLDSAHGLGDLQHRIDLVIAAKKGQDLGAIAHACGQNLQGRMSSLAPINAHLAAEFGAKQPAPAPAAPQQPLILKPIPSPGSH